MVTSNLIDKVLLHQNCSQLNFRKSHQVRWLKLAYQKSFKRPKSVRAESASLPPGLNRVGQGIQFHYVAS